LKNKNTASIGVIGGSGVYDLPALTERREVSVKTPFGAPSGKVLLGTLQGVRCAFIPRHGAGHVLLPQEIPVRANIWALKSLGVERLLAVAAVGSLKEELPPRHFVVPDQLFDKTWGRPSTFFGEGCVAHVAFDRPFCHALSNEVYNKSQALGIATTFGGTYCNMQGPLFSSRAESLYHKTLGFSVIGMTAVTEAKLAREAELCYSLVALVTDFDCWKEGEEVSSHKVVETMKANVADAQRLLAAAIPAAAKLPRTCACGSALAHAVVTNPKAIPPKTRKKLALFIDKYLPKK
jgi:5'-methylthioadenosine phosphorylase